MTRPHPASRPLSRRTALLGLSVAATLGRSSLSIAQANTPNRFVVVILRGALDGMAAVVPYADPGLRRLRLSLLLPEPGQPGGLLDLGGFYGLHPSLVALGGLYRSGQALPVHAIAGPVQNRSHFDCQDLLEMGSNQRITSGWLNRAAGLIQGSQFSETALAMGPIPPMLLRGPQVVGTYAPPDQPAPATFLQNLIAMHANDKVTRPALLDGLRERGFTTEVLAHAAPDAQRRNGFAGVARIAGLLLADPNGPRLAALENVDSWDTHGGQLPRLNDALRNLDAGIAALQDGLGAVWANTVVMVVTEFGRTARVNGSFGTDHGTGGVAFLLGGPVAGGRVLANWPGLADHNLFENRDLQPTADVRSLAKGVLAAQFGLDDAALDIVFPDSRAALPMTGLLHA
jgi:uncharacterized protein (DUF1501 family)